MEHNRVYHLEGSMIMYGKYNSDTLMSLIDMVHRMHNITTWKERLFVGKMNEWLKQELTHFNNEYPYSISTLLFLTTIKREICKNV